MGNARNHHYVSQFYLSGFTKSDSNKILVFEKESNKYFETNIRNIASQRDFNKISIKNKENTVEEWFSKIESKVSKAFENIKKHRDISNKDDLLLLVMYICILAIRNPRKREDISNFKKNIAKIIIAHIKENTDNQEIKNINDNEYDIETLNDSFIDTEHLDKILPYFLKRKWTLLLSDENTGRFITCDHPVVLTPYDNCNYPIGYGYGLIKTEVSFPITNYMAVVGSFESVLPSKIKANRKQVIRINRLLSANSKRQIYLSTRE